MAELREFQNIMPIANIPSVLANGILSHEQATAFNHADVSMAHVQDRRSRVRVYGGLRLHQYANLFFDARNPMMSSRRDMAEELCVLTVSTGVLELAGVVITDQNASSKYVAFYPPNAVSGMDLDYIYAWDWRHPDNQIAEWKHSSAKGAEVLVPNVVPIEFITGAVVATDAVAQQLTELGFTMPITINPQQFFRD
jgi:hypothetical protein